MQKIDFWISFVSHEPDRLPPCGRKHSSLLDKKPWSAYVFLSNGKINLSGSEGPCQLFIVKIIIFRVFIVTRTQ